MPKAGKSGAIENVRHFFSHGHRVSSLDGLTFPYQVHTPAEGVSLRTPQQLKRDHIDYNTWAGAYGLQELIRAAHDDYHDLVLLDRGPWDAGCWLEYWTARQGGPTERDPKATAASFHHEQWMTRSDLHVVLVVDPRTAADREREHRLIEHGGFASNEDGMSAMRRIYELQFEKLQATKARHCPHVAEQAALLLDTTNMAPQAVAIRIITAMFDVVQAKLAHSGDAFIFTQEWIVPRIDGYLPRVRGRRKDLFNWLPEFIEAVNMLPAERRMRLARSIDEVKAPATTLIGQAATAQGQDRYDTFGSGAMRIAVAGAVILYCSLVFA